MPTTPPAATIANGTVAHQPYSCNIFAQTDTYDFAYSAGVPPQEWSGSCPRFMWEVREQRQMEGPREDAKGEGGGRAGSVVEVGSMGIGMEKGPEVIVELVRVARGVGDDEEGVEGLGLGDPGEGKKTGGSRRAGRCGRGWFCGFGICVVYRKISPLPLHRSSIEMAQSLTSPAIYHLTRRRLSSHILLDVPCMAVFQSRKDNPGWHNAQQGHAKIDPNTRESTRVGCRLHAATHPAPDDDGDDAGEGDLGARLDGDRLAVQKAGDQEGAELKMPAKLVKKDEKAWERTVKYWVRKVLV
ncbi:uncharacterized protein L3040_007153 [Drepanopeziza brunnea f. sp. 'multigermtubi']|nr:hypothetical protein L3040_007153 [Drepanopeziza brunnea f. sp. 'multigermtubi']